MTRRGSYNEEFKRDAINLNSLPHSLPHIAALSVGVFTNASTHYLSL
ncbi:MAG: hypothetical protein OXC44_04100 [Proteobacteria bacterium]|nr:hypothetical protein [Pseudomonadota bacterium]